MFTLRAVRRFWLIPLLFILFASSCWADLPSDTLYLTWQRSPDTTMTIQWISDLHQKETTVSYCLKQNDAEWQQIQGETLKFPQTTHYLIHRTELKDLQPNTTYLFKIMANEKIYQFHTLPSQLDHNLHFVVGGDMYHDGIQIMAKTCQQAAKTNPAFVLVGGDIAYAVGSIHLPIQKIDRWIEWIKTWHATMITPQGNLVPVVAAIGNHDLIGHYDQTPQQAAIFSALFPMPGTRIYNTLDFGSYLSIFFLDSGHANPIGGQQTKWLQEALQERQHMTHRFAIYHVPAYPSVRGFTNRQSMAIRRFWVPLFEQEGMQVVFENHDHAYKRTHPLIKNRVHPQGVIYLGDGAWGVEKPRALRRKMKHSYLAKFVSARHFIVVTLAPYQQTFTAVSDQGIVLDEYTKHLPSLTLIAGEDKNKRE